MTTQGKRMFICTTDKIQKLIQKFSDSLSLNYLQVLNRPKILLQGEYESCLKQCICNESNNNLKSAEPDLRF